MSQKTIEVAVVVDKLTADHHGTGTLPYVLILMNVVSVRMNIMGYILFIFIKCMRNICTHSQEHYGVCVCSSSLISIPLMLKMLLICVYVLPMAQVSYLFNDPSAGDVIRLALVKVIILESYPVSTRYV